MTWTASQGRVSHLVITIIQSPHSWHPVKGVNKNINTWCNQIHLPQVPSTYMKWAHDPSIILNAKKVNWQTFGIVIVSCFSDLSVIGQEVTLTSWNLASSSWQSCIYTYTTVLSVFPDRGKLSFSSTYPDNAQCVEQGCSTCRSRSTGRSQRERR